MKVWIFFFHQEFINRLVHQQKGEFLLQQARYFVVTLLKIFTCKSRRSKIPRNYIKKTDSVTAIFSLEQRQHNIDINIGRKEQAWCSFF